MYNEQIESSVEALAVTLDDFDAPHLAVMVRDWGRNMERMDVCLANQMRTIRQLQDEDMYKANTIVDLQEELEALNRARVDAFHMPDFDDTDFDVLPVPMEVTTIDGLIDDLANGAEEMQWLDDMVAMEDEVEEILSLLFGPPIDVDAVIALPYTDEFGNVYPQEDFYSKQGM